MVLGLAAGFKFKAIKFSPFKFNRYAVAKTYRFCFNAFKLTNLLVAAKF